LSEKRKNLLVAAQTGKAGGRSVVAMNASVQKEAFDYEIKRLLQTI
jgi:hypothetical protein